MKRAIYKRYLSENCIGVKTLSEQINECLQYAVKNGITVVSMCSDIGEVSEQKPAPNRLHEEETDRLRGEVK